MMNMLIEYIKRIVDFSDQEIAYFKSGLSRLTLQKGEYFNQSGKTCNQIGFIVDGAFEMSTLDGKGNVIVLEFMLTNQFVTDYVSFITQSPSRVNLIALVQSELLVFDKAFVDKMYERGVNYQKLGRLIAEENLIKLADRIQNNTLQAKQKYERLMNDNQVLIQKIPQYKIASYLGVSPEWLSRIRSKK